MTDLIVFKVGNNRYALKIENIQRIIQSAELTDIPNTHSFIDGMMSYEDGVIKILSFRKLIGAKTYDNELFDLFSTLKMAHQAWLNELVNSVEDGLPFAKTVDPHKCELGMWLDNFNSYDENISVVLKDLMQNHKNLHILGGEVLAIVKENKANAKEKIDSIVHDTFSKTMRNIDSFMLNIESVANSLQKLIIYENGSSCFAIKVDTIEDIAHMEGSQLMSSEESNKNEFLELEGVLDLDGVLINIIKSVKLPN